MNILKRELNAGIKPFLFWTLGLFVLVFAGVIKSTGVLSGGAGMTELINALPRVVQAVIGMVGIDIGTFGGYYAMLAQYAMILVAVYAVHLGNNAVSREAADKTYEFIFTKPRSRSFILCRKLSAGLIYLTLFCVLYFAFSAVATAQLGLAENSMTMFALFSVVAWLVGLLFFSLATMVSSMVKSVEKGAKISNATVLATFAAGVAYDMFEQNTFLRLFSPFKYFTSSELLINMLNPFFAALCIVIAAASLAVAINRFEKRDLSAV